MHPFVRVGFFRHAIFNNVIVVSYNKRALNISRLGCPDIEIMLSENVK